VFLSHRKKIIVNMEKQLIPDTAPYVSTLRKAIDMVSQEQLYDYEIDNTYGNLPFVNRRVETRFIQILRDEKTSVRPLMFQCSAENCPAFVSITDTDTQIATCDACGVMTCGTCHSILHSEVHKCSEDDLRSVQLLREDSKNCPGCNTIIHKIDGCDQMWCTQCSTAFDWNTLEIVRNGRIHNPHYFESLRKSGRICRAAQDAPCGGLPDTVPLRNSQNCIFALPLRYHYVAVIQTRDHTMTNIDVINWDMIATYHRLGYIFDEKKRHKYEEKMYRCYESRMAMPEVRDVLCTWDLYDYIWKIINQCKIEMFHIKKIYKVDPFYFSNISIDAKFMSSAIYHRKSSRV
jgi:hypothetical protein